MNEKMNLIVDVFKNSNYETLIISFVIGVLFIFKGIANLINKDNYLSSVFILIIGFASFGLFIYETNNLYVEYKKEEERKKLEELRGNIKQ